MTAPHHTTGLPADSAQFRRQADALAGAGRLLYDRGWLPATGGNLSARLSAEVCAITESGRNKGALTIDDFLRVDLAGNPLEAGRCSSAETLLHTLVYRLDAEVGAVLHTHSTAATVLSRSVGDHVLLTGYELLKAFRGVTTHETTLAVPVLDNDQDIPRLAARVEPLLGGGEPLFGFLIRGHGLYAWGADVAEALRHLEAFEFLFQCELYERAMK